jgi:anti-sigma B factor antagonist
MDGSGSTLAESPGFRAEASRNGNNSATVRLLGELDIASADAARRALEQLDAGTQQIVLDLSHITFCDAAGMRFLLTAQEQARTTGRDLVVRHASKAVRRVLALTGNLPAICHEGASSPTRAFPVERATCGNYAPSHALSSSRHPRTEPVIQRRPSAVSWSSARLSAVPGPRVMPAVASCIGPRRSASRLGVRSNRPAAMDVPRLVRGTERHAGVASVPGMP